ncbi:hypothetical protein ACTXGU_00195 [Niallia sp. 01092]|uniref:hypothetical protein n=1 Tax=Niallia sp. 01092 TaxID=3457759 RepID=UPI003FD347BC
MAVITDVFEMILIDDDGDVIGKTTLQDSSIEVQVQANDVVGGRGGEVIGVLHSNRTTTINYNDISFDFEWVAKQFGQDVVTHAGIAYHMPKWYLAQDIGGATKITVEKTPATNHEMKIYKEDGQRVTGFSVSGNEVDFTSATPAVAIGESLEVKTYIYNTPAQTQEFFIDNKVFAKGVKAVLETLEVDESTETATHKIQYEFYKAIPDGNFTINTASERTAQAMGSSLRVIKPRTSTVVGIVKRIPIA